MMPRKILKRFTNEVYNQYSRFLLLQHRLRHGRAEEEIEEIKELVTGMTTSVSLTIDHFTLLPSRKDRVLLLNELFLKYWTKILVASLSLSTGFNFII